MSGATSFTERISASGQDAEERVSDGAMDLTSSDLELGFEAGNEKIVGLRWPSVTASGVVTDAWVQFAADETGSDALSLSIAGEDADDAAAFTTDAGDLSGRTKTSATVTWAVPAWESVHDAGAAQRTPDLTAIIQEIVDRPGWAPGQAIVLLFSVASGTGTRTAECADSEPARAAVLHVAYTP